MRRLSVLLWVSILSTACATTGNPDPYEKVNRAVFGFNAGVDHYLVKPVAKAYRYVTPDVVENRVSHFFSNLLEVRNIFNSLLQGKGQQAAQSTGRFLFNSTVGLGGLFDVAAPIGLEKTEGEDFGQTLAHWGVGQGPYLVLPILGSSTLRDGVGLPVDMWADPLNHLEQHSVRDRAQGLGLIDRRAQLFSAERLISGDSYLFIRDAYLQRRQYLINDGRIDDGFGDIDEDF